jgi:hypothetical protein
MSTVPAGRDVTPALIERDLRAALEVGDPARKIEGVLLAQHLPFSFDSRRGRYQCLIPPGEQKTGAQTVQVLVYVDDAMRLSRIEVITSRVRP